MISLRDIARKCVGLTGGFSVLKDFYGYTSIPNPLSLVRQARLLRDGEHVIVHPKILFRPVNFTVDQMMDAMRLVYGDHGIAVIVRAAENLNLPALNRINVGTCPLPPATPTSDINALFNHRNNVGNNEIVIYFVQDVVGFDGCAHHPVGKPGAMVDSIAQVWVVAHEIGHNLDLLHPDQAACNTGTPAMTDRLMTCTWLGSVTNPPPDLIQSEVNTMIKSPLTTRCN